MKLIKNTGDKKDKGGSGVTPPSYDLNVTFAVDNIDDDVNKAQCYDVIKTTDKQSNHTYYQIVPEIITYKFNKYDNLNGDDSRNVSLFPEEIQYKNSYTYYLYDFTHCIIKHSGSYTVKAVINYAITNIPDFIKGKVYHLTNMKKVNTDLHIID